MTGCLAWSAPRREQRVSPSVPSCRCQPEGLELARRSLVRWQKLAALVRLAVHEVEKLAFAFPAQPTRWHVDRLVECGWCHMTAIVHVVSKRLRGRVSASAIKRAFRRAVEARDGRPAGEACVKLLEEALALR